MILGIDEQRFFVLGASWTLVQGISGILGAILAIVQFYSCVIPIPSSNSFGIQLYLIFSGTGNDCTGVTPLAATTNDWMIGYAFLDILWSLTSILMIVRLKEGITKSTVLHCAPWVAATGVISCVDAIATIVFFAHISEYSSETDALVFLGFVFSRFVVGYALNVYFVVKLVQKITQFYHPKEPFTITASSPSSRTKPYNFLAPQSDASKATNLRSSFDGKTSSSSKYDSWLSSDSFAESLPKTTEAQIHVSFGGKTDGYDSDRSSSSFDISNRYIFEPLPKKIPAIVPLRSAPRNSPPIDYSEGDIKTELPRGKERRQVDFKEYLDDSIRVDITSSEAEPENFYLASKSMYYREVDMNQWTPKESPGSSKRAIDILRSYRDPVMPDAPRSVSPLPWKDNGVTENPMFWGKSSSRGSSLIETSVSLPRVQISQNRVPTHIRRLPRY